MGIVGSIPFGKHKDIPLKEVPSPYLRWFEKWYSTEADCPDEDLLDAVQVELISRGFKTTSATTPPPQKEKPPPPFHGGKCQVNVSAEIATSIVSEGRRALARKHHPDMGGSTEKMQSVNATADWLETQAQAVLSTQKRR